MFIASAVALIVRLALRWNTFHAVPTSDAGLGLYGSTLLRAMPWDARTSRARAVLSMPLRRGLRLGRMLGTWLALAILLTHVLPSSATTAVTVSPSALEPPPPPAARSLNGEPRFSFGVRGGFSLPRNDLRVTADRFPSFTVGAFGRYLAHGVHELRPVGEWWYFSRGHQYSPGPSRTQTIDTSVRAMVFGGEYRYRWGGSHKRLSIGGGFYLVRWAVDSVDTVTLTPGGTAQASGNSHWIRPGEGLGAGYRLVRRLELEGRWIHSNYGYERIPVNVIILGAGWRF